MGKPGKREFVQVLRLLEVFRPDENRVNSRSRLPSLSSLGLVQNRARIPGQVRL